LLPDGPSCKQFDRYEISADSEAFPYRDETVIALSGPVIAAWFSSETNALTALALGIGERQLLG
jgi:hypothetical protein